MKICILGDAGHINLLSWVKHFAEKEELDLHIITFNKPCEQIDAMQTHLLPHRKRFIKLRYLLAIPALKKQLQSIKPDILAAYRINSYGFMAVMSGFHPVVAIAQGSDIFYPRFSIPNRFLLRYVIRKAALVHCWASHMESKLMHYGASKDKLLVLPKGIDTDTFRPSSETERKVNGAFALIATRQLRKSYRQDVLLHAIASAKKTIPHLQCVICGDGEYRNELQDLCRMLTIEKRVTFLGSINHDQLPLHLNSAHVYVSMHPSDGVSASLLEAMSCGVFPIVTDNQANRLWIEDGVNGFLYPGGKPNALAEKIIAAFKNPHLRNEAGVKNRNIVLEKASIARNVDLTLDAYSKLIADR